MLYPKEDEAARKLQYTCRTCQFTEEAQSSCVYRDVLNTSAGETAGVTQDVGSDPTVSTNAALDNDECACSFLPVICLCCGCEIRCGICGDVSAEMDLLEEPDTPHSYGGAMQLAEFVMDWDADEYDEEMMGDCPDSETSSVSTHVTSYRDDGAMVIDL